MVALITLWSFFVKTGSFILTVVGLVAVVIAVIFTFEHADIIAKSKKPRSIHTERTAKRYLTIVFFAGITMTLALLFRTFLRGESIRDYFTLPVLVYKVCFLPGCWVISYLLPSKRKKILKERRQSQNASSQG